MAETVVCFGAGPAFKGGMSNYNTSLAKSMAAMPDTKVHIVSWSQQYPSIVPREFKDTVSQTGFLEGTTISCDYLTNYNRPRSYGATVRHIAALSPTRVIIQWSIAIQGLPIGRIIRGLKKACSAEVIVDLHFVVQKEKSAIDRRMTKYGIGRADSFIVHALQTYEELQQLFPERSYDLTLDGLRTTDPGTNATPVIKLFHPIYDLYSPDPRFDIETFKSERGLAPNVFLFFGFIRKYKGLHHAIEAFAQVAAERKDVSFLICGELFWKTMDDKSVVTKLKKATFGLAKKILLPKAEDEKDYDPLQRIIDLGLEDRTHVVSEYIPNEDVNKYFQVADSVVLFYSRATPSGIESLSYNFNVPILATPVGHFPETIQDGKNGYMAADTSIDSMAATMRRSLAEPIPPQNVDAFKEELSWKRYSTAVLQDR